MRRISVTTIATYALLLCAVVPTLVLPRSILVPASATAATPPDELRLTGTVRDFHMTHPDFGLVPFGDHIAGNVALTLGSGRIPVFTAGAGYSVTTQWEDAAGHPIAPHLFGTNGGDGECRGIRIRGSIELISDSTFDAYDSTLGPYAVPGNGGLLADVRTNATADDAVLISGGSTLTGDILVGPGADPADVIDASGGTITGTTGTQADAFPVPVVVTPSDAVVGANVGDVWLKDDPATISSNLHCNKLRISNNAVVTVTGNVVIYAESEFITETGGRLVVSPGSSLDIYVDGKVTLKTESAWSDPSSTRLFATGSDSFKIETKAAFYGAIIAPDRHLELKTEAHVFGSVLFNSIKAETRSAIHADLGGYGTDTGCWTGPACSVVSDSAGASGGPHEGHIAAMSTFAEWFATVPLTNLSLGHRIILPRDGAGVYEYTSPEFFPIDGRLFGNEEQDHNTSFTYTIRAVFDYEECAGQFVEIEGGDGAWLFIDDRLALDVGGVTPAYGQRIDLDRFGLTDGETYVLDLFYAQRNVAVSTFRLTTNIPLNTDPFAPVVTAGFD